MAQAFPVAVAQAAPGVPVDWACGNDLGKWDLELFVRTVCRRKFDFSVPFCWQRWCYMIEEKIMQMC